MVTADCIFVMGLGFVVTYNIAIILRILYVMIMKMTDESTVHSMNTRD